MCGYYLPVMWFYNYFIFINNRLTSILFRSSIPTQVTFVTPVIVDIFSTFHHGSDWCSWETFSIDSNYFEYLLVMVCGIKSVNIYVQNHGRISFSRNLYISLRREKDHSARRADKIFWDISPIVVAVSCSTLSPAQCAGRVSPALIAGNT